jgi:hypothetical protein
MPGAPAPHTTLRRARRWLLGVGVSLVLLASVLVLLSISLAGMTPDWWRTIRTSDPETIRAAEAIENDLANVIYAVRAGEGDVWAVTLRAPDANAWLNTRFAQWLANADAEFEWPEEICDPQAEFDDGLIHLGVRVVRGDKTQVLAASLRPSFDDQGALWVSVESISVGRLPIPSGWVVDRAGDFWPEVLPARLLEDPTALRILDALAGRAPLDPEPALDLGDGRRVRLLNLQPEKGRLRITCRTEYVED